MQKKHTNKTIMDLPQNLHEQVIINDYKITKVLGGYIYCREEPQVNLAHPVFVPKSLELEAINLIKGLISLCIENGVSEDDSLILGAKNFLNEL